MMAAKKFRTIDEYIASFPPTVKRRLRTVRSLVRSAVPGYDETISYNIPAVCAGGSPVVYFAGWKDHIALYPVPRGSAAFEAAVKKWKGSKSSVRFPHDTPLPERFIRQCVRYRLAAIRKRKTTE